MTLIKLTNALPDHKGQAVYINEAQIIAVIASGLGSPKDPAPMAQTVIVTSCDQLTYHVEEPIDEVVKRLGGAR